MKGFKLAFAFILAFFVLVSFGYALDGFPHKRTILINNTANPNNLNDYQVAVNVSYDEHMQNDFDDLRFTWYNESSNSEIKIPYWIESKSDGNWAYVWVKVPFIPANGYGKVYMYYGNSTATSESDPDNTFLRYDDAEIDRLSQWSLLYEVNSGSTLTRSTSYVKDGNYSLNRSHTRSGETFWGMGTNDISVGNVGVKIEAWVLGHSGSSKAVGVALFKDTNNFILFRIWPSGGKLTLIVKQGGTTDRTDYTTIVPSADTWYHLKLYIQGGTVKAYVGDTFIGSKTYNPSNFANSYAGINGFSDGDVFVDNFIVRKYASPEPTASIQKPIITKIKPQDNETINLTNNSIEFKVNVKEPFGNLTNATIYIYENNSLIYQNTTSISGDDVNVSWIVNRRWYDNLNYSWYVEACDSGNVCSATSNSSFYPKNLYGEIINYQAQVVETQENNFNLSLQYNPEAIDNINAKLIYDGTTYIPEKTSNATHFVFSRDLYVPLINSSSENKSFYWNLTITYLDGSVEYYATNSKNQTIYKLTFSLKTSCSASEKNIAKIYAYDEDTLSAISSAKYDVNLKAWFGRNNKGNLYREFAGSLTPSGNNILICLTDISGINLTNQLHYDMRYIGSKSGYYQREKNAFNVVYDGTVKDFKLYLASSSISDYAPITFEVTDCYDRIMEGYYVWIERYYASDGSYKDIEIKKTGVDGKISSYSKAYITTYKVKVTNESELLYTSGDFQISGSSLNIKVCEVEGILSTYNKLQNIYYRLYYDNASGKIKFDWIDTNGIYKQGCLNIKEINLLNGSKEVYNECANITSGGLSYVVTPGNKYSVYAYFKGSIVPASELFLDLSQVNTLLGKEGIIITLGSFLVLVGIGLVGSPAIALVLGILSIFMSVVLQYYYVAVSSLIALIIVGIIYIIKMRR